MLRRGVIICFWLLIYFIDTHNIPVKSPVCLMHPTYRPHTQQTKPCTPISNDIKARPDSFFMHNHGWPQQTWTSHWRTLRVFNPKRWPTPHYGGWFGEPLDTGQPVHTYGRVSPLAHGARIFAVPRDMWEPKLWSSLHPTTKFSIVFF